jgi:hypothetical protein
MLRLQTTKPSNGAAFDLDDLVDDQSLKITTKKIVADAKVEQDLIFHSFHDSFFFLFSIHIIFRMKFQWIMKILHYVLK